MKKGRCDHLRTSLYDILIFQPPLHSLQVNESHADTGIISTSLMGRRFEADTIAFRRQRYGFGREKQKREDEFLSVIADKLKDSWNMGFPVLLSEDTGKLFLYRSLAQSCIYFAV